jgi:NADPH-dependent glutamate synthase beta subunit-like oxidoreductase/Pyruvate/2-oxoacid:ferredoxin oxidoreductase delta subunit
MDTISLTIDGKPLTVPAGTTVLKAARQGDIYIPTLCFHPDLPPAKGSARSEFIFQGDLKIVNAAPQAEGKGCGLCLVEIQGEAELIGSCATEANEGMVVVTDNERIQTKRKENLMPIMARHRHACLTCAQQEGCPRTQCSSNVPENERCCDQLGHCELQNVSNYIGIADATPKWMPTDFSILDTDPLFKRDYNLCIGCTRCVRACQNLRGIDAIGFVFDHSGLIQVGSLARDLKESGCKFCTACVEVCPTGALVDKAVEPGTKEADLVPCKEACPAHIDIPGYLRMVADGKADEAHAIIREKVPFPGILGRICIHPCEAACRRGEVNEPVSICAVKRYAADQEAGLWKNASKVDADTGKRVAVIGSGAAGLTATFYLKKKGHEVTLFDAENQAGGMMRYGIPTYRLPADVLEKEIDDILKLGVDFRPNMQLGKDIHLDQLQHDGFEAVFLAVGARKSRRLPLEGCDLPDVMWGIDFLKDVAQGKPVQLKDNVMVIGGGNVAVDVAMTALRCGAESVSMACLEAEGEMPAGKWEVEGAASEGVTMLPSWGPERVLSENGRVTGMDLVECTCVFDEKGNFCPEFGDQKECILVDQVILAVGQETDLSFLAGDMPVSVKNGLIVVNGESMETDMQGVFAGGDVTSMPGTVIHAIAAGRKGASAIDVALGGNGDIEETLFQRQVPDPFLGKNDNFAIWPREMVPELEPDQRRGGFSEVSLGYLNDQACKEAGRCLQCDLRLNMGCNPAPPERVMVFSEAHILQIPEIEGVYRLFDADKNVLAIKGTLNLKKELLRELSENDKSRWFEIEEDKMYSQRESELIQKYLQEHGEMPGGDDDDLF